IIIHDENSAFIYHLLLTIHEVQLSNERRLILLTIHEIQFSKERRLTDRRWASENHHCHQPALGFTEPFENVGHRASLGGICYREMDEKAREFAIFNGAIAQARKDFKRFS
ncbi:hypothetical protein, partial [Candidatus Entotheonella palauensis]|uniref:hypothetical protein n=1 Tax=Candidatus Entotheonella palauensis TaxID=93172 RepID=UPI0015C42E39